MSTCSALMGDGEAFLVRFNSPNDQVQRLDVQLFGPLVSQAKVCWDQDAALQ